MDLSGKLRNSGLSGRHKILRRSLVLFISLAVLIFALIIWSSAVSTAGFASGLLSQKRGTLTPDVVPTCPETISTPSFSIYYLDATDIAATAGAVETLMAASTPFPTTGPGTPLALTPLRPVGGQGCLPNLTPPANFTPPPEVTTVFIPDSQVVITVRPGYVNPTITPPPR